MAEPLAILHCDARRIWAGGQNQLLLLARGLRERGHTQWIATPPGSPLAARAEAERFPVLAHRHRGEADPRATLGLARHLRLRRTDVVHAHDPHGLTPSALAARLVRPRPAVIGHRRVDFHIRGHALSRWKYSRGADRLIAVSARVREVLIEDGVPPERVTVVRSGIDLETPPPPPGPTLRERIGSPDGAPLVLTIASAVDYKDHPTLIEAAARLAPREPPARWVVLGTGGLLESLRAEVARRGLADRLHYLGFVEGARGFLPQADVFVLSSRTEGLGTSVLDAMAAGTPVAATRAGGIPEMVDDGRTGFLAPIGDAAALAARVDRLLDDRDLARRIAEAARERVRDFDGARTVEETERVYREVLASGPRRARPG